MKFHLATDLISRDGTLYSASIMMLSFCFNVCLVSLFWSVKLAKVCLFTIYPYLRKELISSFNYTKKLAFIIDFMPMNILGVSFVGYISQVVNSIVRPIAIYMVNKAIWIFSVNIKPSQSMSLITEAMNFYNNISMSFIKPCFMSVKSIIFTFEPSEFSRIFIVVKNFLYKRLSNIHAVPLSVSSLYLNNGNLYRNRRSGASLAVAGGIIS